MIEQGKTEQLPDSEAIKQQIIDLVRPTKFGSPKRQLLLDYIEHLRLIDEKIDLADRVGFEGLDSVSHIHSESDLRVTEFKLAILETEMHKKRSTLPGYNETWTIEIENRLFDNLSNAIYDEVSKTTKDVREISARYREHNSLATEEIIAACLKPDAPEFVYPNNPQLPDLI